MHQKLFETAILGSEVFFKGDFHFNSDNFVYVCCNKKK